jgi:hypothetical protein
MPLEFPSNLAPNFFHVDKLPDYGLKLHENELGREIRRFTETTGNKTELRVLYTGMRATEVNTLLSFYRDTKGTFEAFTLPTSFYLSPDEITNSLAGLDDTETWRFLRQPIIKTIISDIYQTEILLISLKGEPSQSSRSVVGFVKPVVLGLNTPKIQLPTPSIVGGFDSIVLDFGEGSSEVLPSTAPLSVDLNLSLPLVDAVLADIRRFNLLTLSLFTASGTTSLFNRTFQSIELLFTQGTTGHGTLAGWDEMQSIIVTGTFTSNLRTIHLVNTGSGVASTTLPSNAPDDSIVIYSDYAGTSSTSPTGFGLNSFTLNAPVGETIQGQASRVFNVENTSIQLIKKGTRWNIVGTELATGNSSGGNNLPVESLQTQSGGNLDLNTNQAGKILANSVNTSNFNLTLTQNTLFINGWYCYVRNDSNCIITVNPSSGVTINHSNGLTLGQNELGLLICNGGNNWYFQRLSNFIKSIGNGLNLSNAGALTNPPVAESLDGQIDTPSNETYTLIASARFGFTIEDLTVFTTSGTCTVAIQINGVNVGALNGINVTSTSQTVNSTTAKTVTTGQRVTLVVSSNASAIKMAFSLGLTRT